LRADPIGSLLVLFAEIVALTTIADLFLIACKADFHACRSIRQFGLVAAVSRIAAILSNGLDLTDMNGPLLPSAQVIDAAMQLP
jgi:hypothetical protein